MSRKLQEVITETRFHLLKSGHEKSKMVPAAIYLMGIILNLAMNKKWRAWLGSLALRSCISIGNLNVKKSVLAKITVTATE